MCSSCCVLSRTHWDVFHWRQTRAKFSPGISRHHSHYLQWEAALAYTRAASGPISQQWKRKPPNPSLPPNVLPGSMTVEFGVFTAIVTYLLCEYSSGWLPSLELPSSQTLSPQRVLGDVPCVQSAQRENWCAIPIGLSMPMGIAMRPEEKLSPCSQYEVREACTRG